MGLADSIAAHNVRKQGLAPVLDRLDSNARADLIAALDDPDVRHVAIARGLGDHGIPTSEASVRRWREARQVTGL